MRAIKRESKIVAECKKLLTANGWLVWKNHGGPMSQAGRPDLEAIKGGRFLAIEVKRPGQRATPLQLATLEKIRRHGGLAFVVTSSAEVAAILAEIGLDTPSAV